jgi:hypothetical protein
MGHKYKNQIKLSRKIKIIKIMQEFLMQNPSAFIAMLLWMIPWKGVALWKAARNGHKWWFIALLVINTMAALEIIYIFFFSKKQAISSQENKVE